MLALVLVAVSVGASNMAASIGIGAGGVGAGTRLRLIVIFGALEAGMPVLGLALGHGLAVAVDRDARWIAAVLLVAIGAHGIGKTVRGGGLPRFRAPRPAAAPAGAQEAGPRAPRPRAPLPRAPRPPGPRPPGPRPLPGRRATARMLVSGFALSLDNLVAGFALGAFRVGLLAGVVVFGGVSVLMSLAGLELGARVGRRSAEGGELIGGAVLIGVGVAIGFGALG